MCITSKIWFQILFLPPFQTQKEKKKKKKLDMKHLSTLECWAVIIHNWSLFAFPPSALGGPQCWGREGPKEDTFSDPRMGYQKVLKRKYTIRQESW